MNLQIPKKRKRISKWKLASILKQSKSKEGGVFYTRDKSDYSALLEYLNEDKTKPENKSKLSIKEKVSN